jgi:hypothetical protein
VTEVARSLQWSHAIENLATRVVQGMLNVSADHYNALHLRVEKDARDWSMIMGGKQVSRPSLHNFQPQPCALSGCCLLLILPLHKLTCDIGCKRPRTSIYICGCRDNPEGCGVGFVFLFFYHLHLSQGVAALIKA